MSYSKSLWDKVVQQLSDSLIVASSDGTILSVNNTSLTLLEQDGISARVNLDCSNYFDLADSVCDHIPSRNRLKRNFRQVVESTDLESTTYFKYASDSKMWWLRAVVSQLDPADNKFLIILSDITAPFAIERDLHHLRHMTRLAFKAQRTGIVIVNLLEQSIRIDPWMRQILDFDDTSEPDYNDWLGKVHPDDARRLTEHEDQRCSDDAPRDEYGNSNYSYIEYRMLRADGSIIWVSKHGIVERNSFGTAWRITCSITDITERKLVAQELERSEQRYRSLVEASAQIVWRYEAAVEKVQTGYIQTTGAVSGQLSLSEALRAIHPVDRRLMINTWEGALREGKPFRVLCQVFLSDKYRHMTCSGIPVKNAAGRVLEWVGMLNDIHEQVIAQQELAERNQQIQKLADQLLDAQEKERRRISRELHDDLNQKIAAISMKVSELRPFIKSEYNSELADLQKDLHALADQVRRISHTLHPAVLEHAGLVVALRSFCEEINFGYPVAVNLEVDQSSYNVPAETALALYRVTQEALRNCLNHSNATTIKVRLHCDGRNLTLSIDDDGSGFSLGKKRTSGLGLVSMEERIRLAGGKFEVTSYPGKGTKVTATVPVAERTKK